jgi:ABC-2 type transport system ATP-binding protein
LIASLDLEGVVDRTVSSLSGGQRRRLDIAMGLIHSPQLLFLDEPSTGLDPQNRANLQAHIARLRAEHGTTVVLTTHYLDEADSMAERVIVIDHGVVIADDTPERLKTNLAGDRILLTFDTETEAARAAACTDARTDASTGGCTGAVERDGRSVRIRVTDAPRRLPRLLRELDDAGIEVATAEVARPTLDDVFLNLTGRSLREGGTQSGSDNDTGVDSDSGSDKGTDSGSDKGTETEREEIAA